MLKWLEIDQDKLHMKFSPLNVDFSSSCPNPLDSRSLHTWVSKKGTPLKSGYLSDVGLSSMKTVAHGHRPLLIITSIGNKLLRNVNIDDLE